MIATRKPIYIYVLQDPFTTEWRYVGKTDDPKTRLKNHCNERSHTHRCHWIQSIIRRGAKPRMKILQLVPVWADWKSVERMWIEYAILSGWNITNGTYGGDGVDATPEVRQKISNAIRGRKLSPAHRAIAIKGLVANVAGSKLPKFWCEAISRGKAGVKFSDSHKRQISEGKRKVTPAMESEILSRVSAGESQGAISRAMGISQPTVHAVKHGLRKYSKGPQCF